MFTLTRYIFNKITTPILSLTLILIGTVWLTQSLRFIEIIVNNNVSIKSYFALVVYLIPDLVVTILPVCVLIGTLLGYQRLIADHELNALQYLGLSHWQIAKPMLLIASIIAFLTGAMNIYVVPKAFQNFRDKEHIMRNQFSAALLHEGTFNLVKDITIYIKKKNNNYLEGIFIHNPGLKSSKPYTIIAQSGQLRQFQDKIILELSSGNRQEVDSKTGKISFIYFDNFAYDLSSLTKAAKNRSIKPYERSLIELLNFEQFEDLDAQTRNKMQAEAHQRILIPLLILAYPLIVINLLLYRGKKYRNKKRYRILATLAICLILHGTIVTLINLNAKSSLFILLAYTIVFIIMITSLLKLSLSRKLERIY